MKAIVWPGAAVGAASEPAADIGRLERAGYVLGTVCGLVAALMVTAAWVRGAVPLLRRDRTA